MPTPTQIARAHYLRQQSLARDVARALDLIWAALDTADLIGSWSSLADRAAQVVALAQYSSAVRSIDYIAIIVDALEADSSTLATIDPRALSGTAADGRPLASLLTGGVFRVREMLAAGFPLSEAMLSGQSRFLRAGVNEVVQAGISAASASIGVDIDGHGLHAGADAAVMLAVHRPRRPPLPARRGVRAASGVRLHAGAVHGEPATHDGEP